MLFCERHDAAGQHGSLVVLILDKLEGSRSWFLKLDVVHKDWLVITLIKEVI